MIYIPTPQTLAKYGLSADEWKAILLAQGNVCGVCAKVPKTGRYVTDHEHIRGWKAMPPEKRKLYVRGITCWWCNKTYLGRGITLDIARGVVRYLEAYERRTWHGY